jgi:hypothetical protein
VSKAQIFLFLESQENLNALIGVAYGASLDFNPSVGHLGYRNLSKIFEIIVSVTSITTVSGSVISDSGLMAYTFLG